MLLLQHYNLSNVQWLITVQLKNIYKWLVLIMQITENYRDANISIDGCSNINNLYYMKIKAT